MARYSSGVMAKPSTSCVHYSDWSEPGSSINIVERWLQHDLTAAQSHHGRQRSLAPSPRRLGFTRRDRPDVYRGASIGDLLAPAALQGVRCLRDVVVIPAHGDGPGQPRLDRLANLHLAALLPYRRLGARR